LRCKASDCDVFLVVSELVFHIGFHKTGTTALQAYLRRHADEIAAGGLRYPSPLIGPGHAEEIKRFEVSGELLVEGIDIKKFVESSSGGVLISSERLCNLSEGDVLRLRQSVGGKVKIFAMVRDFREFLGAAYFEQLKNGVTKEEPGSFMLRNAHLSNFEVRLRPWRSVFGEESVEIFRYEDGLDPMVQQLLGLTSDRIPKLSLDGIPVLNKSASAFALIAYQRLEAAGLFLSDDKGEAIEQRKELFELLSSSSEYVRPAALTALSSAEGLDQLLLEFDDAMVSSFGLRILRDLSGSEIQSIIDYEAVEDWRVWSAVASIMSQIL